ncbi:hypothetical protein GCM10007857_53270 [Bradyrhizobium iriomotense]|uniref:Uncharacterized protein n=1 Tax=Bradyrhizobium iriomotense TaxID=441950 RepID=A0ABQ6B2E9_9BRAD|nr:hypothetical protein GCM10007857_53270 [Bradyrhizobium iriomotense]
MLQHPNVLRGARETHAERCRKLPDRELPFRQMTKHCPPRWIREGMKNGVEMRELFNHVVKHTRPKWIVNRLV